MKDYLFTSESVTQGHPDKLCDLISDSVLDAYLEKDPFARVACEVFAYMDGIHIAGEISAAHEVDIERIARGVIKEIGYTEEECGFDHESCKIQLSISAQSADISMGVDRAMDTHSIGAGDQGMMFGFACDETDTYMPLPISLAHALAARLDGVRKSNLIPYLLPDGKTQVTVKYEKGQPQYVDTIIVSTQHLADVNRDRLIADIKKHVITPIVKPELMKDHTKILINPTGRFVTGGPKSDVGLTGRKIIVDTYGGSAAHGGGAFSGKDATKVDRSAAYMTRYVAKNIVAAGIAKRCQIQIAYAIGVAKPVSITVDTFDTSTVDDQKLAQIVSELFDFSPGAIIDKLSLRRPIFKNTAVYGHFGRKDIALQWESLDSVDLLKKYTENL